MCVTICYNNYNDNVFECNNKLIHTKEDYIITARQQFKCKL